MKQFAELFFDKQWLALSGFRLLALLVAIVQIQVIPDQPGYFVPASGLIVAAALYTGLKLMQPWKWHDTGRANTGLFALDVFVSAALYILSGVNESPFLMYTLTPVASSALLLPGRATLAVAMATGAYVMAALARFSPGSLASVENAIHDLPIYLTALGAAATLPYLFNAYSRRRFHSTTVLAERRRLSHEIHDELCQVIYGLRWQVQDLRSKVDASQPAARNLAEIDRLLGEVEQEARGSIELLRGFNTGRPFLSQLEDYMRQLEKDTGIHCRLETEIQEVSLDRMIEIETLHICQEALRNAAKHSGARHVAVKLKQAGRYLQITIADDGRGFDAATQADRGRGLRVMKERAESLWGRLLVVSAPGTGAEIRLEVPRKG
ncbi:MAG: hypothetical protein HY673_02395 [Chloroflexi bacterium]|nr:hypothetical protein [Chloroflexota bacterium]